MKNLPHNLFIAFCLLLCLLATQARAAENNLYALESVQASDGFYTSQPTIDSGHLLKVVEETDQYLLDKRATLEIDIEKHRDAGNNILLAAIMPGGLIYMAYHKGQQNEAENNLALVEQSQKELRKDRTRLDLDNNNQPVLLARFP